MYLSGTVAAADDWQPSSKSMKVPRSHGNVINAMEPSLSKIYITSVLPILTHVRDRAFFFCRILVGFPRSSEKPASLIAQIFKPSSALATTEPYSLDCPCSLQLFSKQIPVVQTS
jgi:hypothetical protein